jgi:hypothetical protein
MQRFSGKPGARTSIPDVDPSGKKPLIPHSQIELPELAVTAHSIIPQPAGFYVRKISLILILLGAFSMFGIDCRANCTQGLQVDSSVLPTDAFKGHAVFVWKEGGGYLFVWLLDTDMLIDRKRVAKQEPIVTEAMIVAHINRLKDMGKKQFIRFIFVENPKNPSFLDESHYPMRPEEEFSDLIDKLRTLAEGSIIIINFQGALNNRTSRFKGF